ncbi:MAG: hypothetical protein ACI857_000520 [Arenicella sp.]|jgi:hypothetical protein
MSKANIDINRTTILNSEQMSIVVTAKNLQIIASSKKIQLEILVTPEVYKIIDANHLFNLEQENRGEILGGKFDEAKPFKIVLQLKDEFVESITAANQDQEQLKLMLIKELDNNASKTLRSIDSWQALNVTQAIDLPSGLSDKGAVSFGFQTKWAEASIGLRESTELGSLLESFLTAQEVEFKKYKHQEIWQVDIHQTEESWLCNIHLLNDQKMLMIVCHRPINIPAELIEITNEYIARANYGLVNGNFALNFESGELNYKTSAQIMSSDAFETTLDFLIRQSIFSYSKYMTGLDLLLSGEISPKELIAIKEKA